MLIFFANGTHLLARTQEQKFKDVFLVKIANKRTTLKISINFYEIINFKE